jgi:hypothetical protein
MGKKGTNCYKAISYYSILWGKEYGGAVYGKSGQDLKAAKEFLQLYPEFFQDEAEQIFIYDCMQRYLKDNFWYQPNGTPPMFHPFWCFVKHIDKYQNAIKPIAFDSKLYYLCEDCKQPVKRINKDSHKYNCKKREEYAKRD